jgi:trehalose-6-phosphate synthase
LGEHVNRKFAGAVLSVCRADDFVWIDDCQLTDVSRHEQETSCLANLGFFLRVIRAEDRDMRVGSFPIGIDSATMAVAPPPARAESPDEATMPGYAASVLLGFRRPTAATPLSLFTPETVLSPYPRP